MVRPVVPTGIGPLDELIQGGLPIGAMTELMGDVCSGRMSLALSFLSQVTGAEKVCAWIDASNTFNPAAASAAGVDLRRLLWVRCGVSETVSEQETRKFALPSECFTPKPVMRGLHGGGHGTHPRNEVIYLRYITRTLPNVTRGLPSSSNSESHQRRSGSI
jgi:recombination protein RecA